MIGYTLSFWFMALTLKVMPVGYLIFGQRLDFPALAGIALILLGILVIHLFSNTTSNA